MNSNQEKPAEDPWVSDTRGDRIARLGFLAALLLLAFGYGVATMKWHIFPYGIIRDANLAVEALQQVEVTDTPSHFIRYEADDAEIGPIQSFAADPGDLIVMTGGFYYRPDLCPEFGCIAWIMDRSGKVYHTWSLDPYALFSDGDFPDHNGFKDAKNISVQGTDIDADGNLIVTFQGRNMFPYQVGIAKLSPSGDVLWKRIDKSHHWPTVGPDGRIYVPTARISPPDDKILGMNQTPACPQGKVYQEGLRIIEADGSSDTVFWFEDVVRESDARALAYTVRDDCDPYHINGIDLVNAAGAEALQAAGVEDAAVGDMIASLRSSSTFVIMDTQTGLIKRILYGPMVAQHSPATLPNGSVLAVDNLGGHAREGRSRIISLSMNGHNFETVFPRPGRKGQDFRTDEEGAVNVNDDGTRILVAETQNGRVLEVDIETGNVLWTFEQIGSLEAYNARAGVKSDQVIGRFQAQGADYISRAAVEQFYAPLN